MVTPNVSVCVVTYNHDKYIQECLTSVIAQAGDGVLEILVGDDQSTDDTARIVDALAQEFPQYIRYVRHQERLGGARNYQALIREARGAYIAHLDGDDSWLPGKLAAQLRFLDTHPECVAVYSNALVIDDRGARRGVFNNPLDEKYDINGLLLVDSLLARDLELFWAAAKQLALPALTLGLFVMAPLMRMTRASMLGVLSSEFIRTARASGLPHTQVLYAYALRNALLPVVTTLGMVFSFLLGSNVLVEKVFAWPGIGSYVIEALVSSDYAPVQGFVLTMALLYVALNLAIDVTYVLIDPRVGIEG